MSETTFFLYLRDYEEGNTRKSRKSRQDADWVLSRPRGPASRKDRKYDMFSQKTTRKTTMRRAKLTARNDGETTWIANLFPVEELNDEEEDQAAVRE